MKVGDCLEVGVSRNQLFDSGDFLHILCFDHWLYSGGLKINNLFTCNPNNIYLATSC